jgi:hypothetical protein
MEPKLGQSMRGIARNWGVSAPYVSKFIRRSGLTPLPDGSYDLAQATRLREKYTIVGRGQRKLQRAKARQAARAEVRTATAPQAERSIRMCDICGQAHWFWTHAICSVCHSDYVLYSARRIDHSPDPQRFCSDKCAGTAPPPPRKLICQQCADPEGYYADSARRDGDSGDPQRYCDQDCENDAAMAKTQKETRYRLWVHAILEHGDTKEDLEERGWSSWGGGRPWPRKRKAR